VKILRINVVVLFFLVVFSGCLSDGGLADGDIVDTSSTISEMDIKDEKCSGGMIEVPHVEAFDDKCRISPGTYDKVCISCGDGVCNTDLESRCNCLADCIDFEYNQSYRVFKNNPPRVISGTMYESEVDIWLDQGIFKDGWWERIEKNKMCNLESFRSGECDVQCRNDCSQGCYENVSIKKFGQKINVWSDCRQKIPELSEYNTPRGDRVLCTPKGFYFGRNCTIGRSWAPEPDN